MKNKILNSVALAAISCSSLVSYADSPNSIQKESSQINNIASDITITSVIKKEILNNKEMDFFNIHVTTINGKVTLAGIVPNKDIKNKLVSLAKNTKNVLDVDDKLKVSESGVIEGYVSDLIISNEIKFSYLTDEIIGSLNLYVDTKNGEVTVIGVAPSELVKSKIISIAKNVESVKKVISYIEVDKSVNLKKLVSDSVITNNIKLQLLRDNSMSAYDIHVETVNNNVTLQGIVASDSIKDKIISMVKSQKGVENVIPMLVVYK